MNQNRLPNLLSGATSPSAYMGAGSLCLGGRVQYLKIRNWDRWQSYRKDRGQPPWIKLHREVMRNPEWVSLTDAQRGQLVAMWLLAADRDGAIPASARVIQRLCMMDSEPDLQLYMSLGFIEHDASLASTGRQHDQPETETEAEAEADAEAEQDSVALSRDRDSAAVAEKARKEEVSLAEYRAWASGLEGADGNPPAMVRGYIKAMEQAVEEFYERNGGSFTALKKARFAKRMGRFGADHQLLAIEIYVDAYAGKRPEAYIVGIADKKRRLSRQELEAEWVRHRRSMNGMGLSDLVEA